MNRNFVKILGVLALFHCLAALPALATPTITRQPQPVTVLAGKTATFSVTATGSGTLHYQWYKNGYQIQNAIKASYTTPATTDGDNYSSFYVTVTDSASSLNSNTASLMVEDQITICQQPASQTVTIPAVAVFQAWPCNGGQDIKYQWTKNGKPLSTNNTWGELDYEVSSVADNGAIFQVKVSNSVSSAYSQNAVLTVKPANTSGTYPIVGNWAGTATYTGTDASKTVSQVVAAFTQNSYSVTGTVVYTDDSGTASYATGIASLNNLNVYATDDFDYSATVSIAAVFSTDHLTLTGTGLSNTSFSQDVNSGTGKIVVSSDHNTMTGSATLSDGSKMTWTLKREK